LRAIRVNRKKSEKEEAVSARVVFAAFESIEFQSLEPVIHGAQT
jgi:hypothetical protein